jgi:hypothetical protein
LINQIRIISDMSKGLIQRIGGGEVASLEDNEATFDDLYTRIDKTIEILRAAKRETFSAPEDLVTLALGRPPTQKFYKLSALEFVQKCKFSILVTFPAEARTNLLMIFRKTLQGVFQTFSFTRLLRTTSSEMQAYLWAKGTTWAYLPFL